MLQLATEGCTPRTDNGMITLPMFTTVVRGQVDSLIQNINNRNRPKSSVKKCAWIFCICSVSKSFNQAEVRRLGQAKRTGRERTVESIQLGHALHSFLQRRPQNSRDKITPAFGFSFLIKVTAFFSHSNKTYMISFLQHLEKTYNKTPQRKLLPVMLRSVTAHFLTVSFILPEGGSKCQACLKVPLGSQFKSKLKAFTGPRSAAQIRCWIMTVKRDLNKEVHYFSRHLALEAKPALVYNHIRSFLSAGSNL